MKSRFFVNFSLARSDYKKIKSLSQKKEVGFTLVEVLVITGLTAIIMLSAVSMFMTFLISQARVTQRQQLKNAGNSVIKQITQVLREAKAIEPCSATPLPNITYTDLTNIQGTYELSAQGSNIGIAFASGGQPAFFITPADMNVTAFSASCFSSEQSQLIRINFTINNPKTTGPSGQPLSQDFSTSIQLRN